MNLKVLLRVEIGCCSAEEASSAILGNIMIHDIKHLLDLNYFQ